MPTRTKTLRLIRLGAARELTRGGIVYDLPEFEHTFWTGLD